MWVLVLSTKFYTGLSIVVFVNGVSNLFIYLFIYLFIHQRAKAQLQNTKIFYNRKFKNNKTYIITVTYLNHIIINYVRELKNK